MAPFFVTDFKAQLFFSGFSFLTGIFDFIYYADMKLPDSTFISGRGGAQSGGSVYLVNVSLLGWLTMKAEMRFMVNCDRQPVCIFASHFAKEIAHGKSSVKQRQRKKIFYTS